MQNTITVGALTLNVANAQRPFSNNFVQLAAKIAQYEGVDEVVAHVQCTADSVEPGRTYSVSYSLQGELLACNTTN